LSTCFSKLKAVHAFKQNAFLNWILKLGCFAPENGDAGKFEKRLGRKERGREESQLLPSV
jgi:hypothetical protein